MFITILLELLVISLELKNITVENMVRRNGNVTSVQKFMLFNLIGRLTPKPVVQESIDVIVEQSSPGRIASLHTEHSAMHWPKKVPDSQLTQP